MSSGSSKKSREETLLPSSAPLSHPIPIPSLLPPSTLPLPPIREEHPLDEVVTLSNNETTSTCTTIPPPATFVPPQSQGDVTVRAACRPHPFSAGSQNASLFPSSSMTTANTTTTPLSEDELIFQKVDLKLKESLDKFFEIQSGKGDRKPPATYVGFFWLCWEITRGYRIWGGWQLVGPAELTARQIMWETQSTTRDQQVGDINLRLVAAAIREGSNWICYPPTSTL